MVLAEVKQAYETVVWLAVGLNCQLRVLRNDTNKQPRRRRREKRLAETEGSAMTAFGLRLSSATTCDRQVFILDAQRHTLIISTREAYTAGRRPITRYEVPNFSSLGFSNAKATPGRSPQPAEAITESRVAEGKPRSSMRPASLIAFHRQPDPV